MNNPVLVPMLAVALLLAGAGAGAGAMAQTPPPVLAPVAIDAPVVTRHAGVFNGTRIAYSATVESFDGTGLDGKPATRLVATSYVADGNRERRPLLFVFNGGPIAATTPLHFGMFGPKRLAVPDDVEADPASFELVDNVYSPLDVADVIIFDPASTGFSRTLPGIDPASQFSTAEDARQLVQLVQAWGRRHGRERSPVYLVGESYGTLRAVEAATQLRRDGTPASGLFLLGQAINIIEYAQRRDNIVSYAVSLPTLAALGWYHGKVQREGRSFEQFVKAAEDYGAGEYLSVLFLGERAPRERRLAVAQRLQAFTGLPADVFMKADLKVAKTQYQRELFPGQVLDTNDGRYLRPADKAMARSGPDYAGVAAGYYRDLLKVPASAGVYSTGIPTLGLGLNGWDWDAQKSPFGDWPWVGQVRELMKADPGFRVFVGNGYYDTQTTLGAMDYLAAQSGWPSQRVRTRRYQGGHMMYTVEASAKQIGDDIRAMLAHEW